MLQKPGSSIVPVVPSVFIAFELDIPGTLPLHLAAPATMAGCSAVLCPALRTLHQGAIYALFAGYTPRYQTDSKKNKTDPEHFHKLD